VIAMLVFPTAYTLVAPYSEPLFLAFAIWAFVRAREDDWRGAGVLTLLAAATRLQGAFLIPALAVEYWVTRRRVDRDALWLLVGLGGPLIYLAINYLTFGNPLFFLEIQRRVFTVTTVAPWAGVQTTIQNALAFQPTENWATVFLAPLVALVLLALVTLWTAIARGGRASYFVYAALTLLSFVTLSWPISTPRYLIGVFPLFLAAGRIGARPSVGPPLIVVSTLLLGAFMTLFLMGHWAF
jgi:Gpi18-like mannosyltransferase